MCQLWRTQILLKSVASILSPHLLGNQRQQLETKISKSFKPSQQLTTQMVKECIVPTPLWMDEEISMQSCKTWLCLNSILKRQRTHRPLATSNSVNSLSEQRSCSRKWSTVRASTSSSYLRIVRVSWRSHRSALVVMTRWTIWMPCKSIIILCRWPVQISKTLKWSLSNLTCPLQVSAWSSPLLFTINTLLRASSR